MKFIHTADIHLGAEPDSLMPWSSERSGEIEDTFQRLLERAGREETDLLLIAGDLFHRQPRQRDLKELDYWFSQIPHVQIVIIAGNHDYIGPHSFYKNFKWSDNVSFFRKNHLSYIYLREINTLVYGMSYDRSEITEPVYDGIRPLKRFADGRAVPMGCMHILLAHGGDARHIPINKKRLDHAGFDYVAMGHIHHPWIGESGRIAYSGSLEPVASADEGKHGYIRGEILGGQTRVEFVPFASRSYKSEVLEVEPQMTMQEIADRAAVLVDAGGRDNIYKIALNGRRAADLRIEPRYIKRCGRVLSVTDHTVPDFDYDRLAAENADNIIGQYIRQVQAMDISEAMKQKTLDLGVSALYLTGSGEESS